jgi:hypothetical protein
LRLLTLLSTVGLLSAAAMAQPPGSKLDLLCGNDPALRCLSSDLLQARQEILGGAQPGETIQRNLAHSMRGGRLQVNVTGSDLNSLLTACRSAGFEIRHSFDRYGVAAVTIACDDPCDLDLLTSVPGVRRIFSEPRAATRAGLVEPQADISLNAENAKALYGVDGSGICVGVLSDSIFDARLGSGMPAPPITFPATFTGTTDQVSGDLPEMLYVIDPGPGPLSNPGSPEDSDEGNAMAQLIYDVAPGCDISFASAFTGYFEFADNITALRTDPMFPADIIVDDVFYFAEPIYQDGPIALAYADALAAGVPGFTAAGNNDNSAHESVFTDVNPSAEDMAFPPTGDDLHDFGGGDTHLTLSASAGSFVFVTLRWAEPYGGGLAAGPGSEADLDLYITRNANLPLTLGNIWDASTDFQGFEGNPDGDPVEVVGFPAPGGPFHVVVEHYAGINPGLIHIDVNGASIVDSNLAGARTVSGHSMAAGAHSVAAAFFCDIESGGFASPTFEIDPENFTSDGGMALPVFFGGSGNRLMTPELRSKPDVTGPDGSNTTFFASSSPSLGGLCDEPDGIPNFYGTSAAAPNVAAVAALMLQGARDKGMDPTPQEIFNALETSAIDINSPTQRTGPGWDARTGHGYVDTVGALNALGITLPLAGITVK